MPTQAPPIVHALRFRWLTPAYDLVAATTHRRRGSGSVRDGVRDLGAFPREEASAILVGIRQLIVVKVVAPSLTDDHP